MFGINVVIDHKLMCSRMIIVGAFLPQLFQVAFAGFVITPFRAAIIIAIISFVMNEHGLVRFRGKTITSLGVLFFVWSLFSLFSLVWSFDFSGALKTFMYLVMAFIAILFIVISHETIEDYIVTLRILSYVIIIHVIIGVYESKTGNYFFSIGDWRIAWYTQQKYPIGMFYNTNNYALFCYYSVFIILLLIFLTNSNFSRIVYLIAEATLIYLISITRSRAELLALFIAGFTFVITYSISFRKKNNLFLAGMVILIIMILFIFRSNAVFALWKNTISRINLATLYNDPRYNLFRNGLYFLDRTFGIGIGSGGSEYWLSNHAIYNTGSLRIWHNFWIEVAAEFGIIVFCMFVFIYFRFIIFYIQKAVNDRKLGVENRVVFIIMASLLVGFIVGGLGPSSLINVQWNWVMFGIIFCGKRIYEGSQYEMCRNSN